MTAKTGFCGSRALAIVGFALTAASSTAAQPCVNCKDVLVAELDACGLSSWMTSEDYYSGRRSFEDFLAAADLLAFSGSACARDASIIYEDCKRR